MYGSNQEIEYSKLSDPLTSFNDDSKVGGKVMHETTLYMSILNKDKPNLDTTH